jgi:hypothetical protein
MNPNPGRSIELQAYDGTNIANFIDVDPSPRLIQLTRQSIGMTSLVRAGLRILRPPTGRYNCHGLVFASRRTNIDHPALQYSVNIDDILRRDRYSRVNPPLQLGDIVAYRRPKGEIEHTGFLSRIERVGQTDVVFVWSKWGSLDECEHLETDYPFTDYQIEYWRLGT